MFNQNVADLAAAAPLPAHEQARLLRRVKQGRQAAAALKNNKKRSGRQRARLRARVEAGRQARDTLVRTNGRLVVSIARRYARCGVPLDDLCQEGALGLMRAIERFEPERGFRLSTYATWWIRQSIGRALANQSRLIRLPAHQVDRLARANRAAGRLAQSLGRRPEPEEVAAALKLDPEKLAGLRQNARHPLRLEAPLDQENDACLGDLIADVSRPLDELMIDRQRREAVGRALDKLAARERRILELRYGLGGDRPQTYEQIGARFGLTRERIRQIEAQALATLRHPVYARPLAGFLDEK